MWFHYQQNTSWSSHLGSSLQSSYLIIYRNNIFNPLWFPNQQIRWVHIQELIEILCHCISLVTLTLESTSKVMLSKWNIWNYALWLAHPLLNRSRQPYNSYGNHLDHDTSSTFFLSNQLNTQKVVIMHNSLIDEKILLTIGGSEYSL